MRQKWIALALGQLLSFLEKFGFRDLRWPIEIDVEASARAIEELMHGNTSKGQPNSSNRI